MLENRMVIDSEWRELEYGVPAPRKMSAWEREEYENERQSYQNPSKESCAE